MPIEKVSIDRVPPKYDPPVRFRALDPKRPTLIMDLNGVLCVPWFNDGKTSTAPDLDAVAFDVVEVSRHRSSPITMFLFTKFGFLL